LNPADAIDAAALTQKTAETATKKKAGGEATR
jgi:hypothetical protein